MKPDQRSQDEKGPGWGHIAMCRGSPVTRGKARQSLGTRCREASSDACIPWSQPWGKEGLAIQGHRCTHLTDLIRSQSSGLGASYLYWAGFSFTYCRSKGEGEAGLPQL